MAIVQKAPRRSHTVLLLCVLVVVGLGAVWYFFFAHDGSLAGGDGGITGTPAAEPVNPNIPTALFSDPRFTELKVYSRLPLSPGPVGRDNPFAPLLNGTAAPAEIGKPETLEP